MPNAYAIAILVITVVTFYLYTRPWIRIEVVSLGMLTTLLVMFYLFPFEGAHGAIDDRVILRSFGHEALVAICCLMILGRGLTLTGALEPAVRLLARLWRVTPAGGLLVTLIFVAMASAVINDTPVLVLMLPLLLSLAERTGSAASRTLMPVNFAILSGGMLTSIGTSTNILVLSIATDLGLPPMGIFSFTPIAAMGVLVAIPYLWLIAPRLLPAHAGVGAIAARQFQARVIVEESGKLVNRSIAEASKILGRSLIALKVQRGDETLDPVSDLRLQANDAITVIDTPAGLREISDALGTPLIDRKSAEQFIADADSSVDQRLAEIVISEDAALVGSSLNEIRFAEKYGVIAVAVYRASDLELRQASDINRTRLQAGDVLLVQGREDRIANLRRERGLMLIDSSLRILRTPRAPWALAIMAAVVAVAGFKVLPIHIAALLGVIAMLATRCVLIGGIGRALSLEVVLLVASSVALGQSLVSTGAADWIAAGASVAIQGMPPAAQLAAFITFSALLTNFVSNSAAAAIGTPIAMSMAQYLGAPLEPFVLAILFGANLSFATPMAYQTNLLIMSAAGYTFRDFLRVGTPLVVLMVFTLSILMVRHYEL